MILYHATRLDVLSDILRDGLVPQVPSPGRPTDPIHLSARDMREFITGIWSLQPGGMYEHENGHATRAVLLRVDASGLELETDGPDGEDHFMYRGIISPDRITVAES